MDSLTRNHFSLLFDSIVLFLRERRSVLSFLAGFTCLGIRDSRFSKIS